MSNVSSADEPRLESVTCASPAGLHRMAYWEWGDRQNDRVLLCVHGLTRTGRDFDPLARAMAKNFRVVCPDVVGRGRSDWLIDPASYIVPQYVADMVTLIARLNPRQLSWVGTSMGGVIGLALAGALEASPVTRPSRGRHGLGSQADIPLAKMVLNDIGPAINTTGLARITDYVGQPEHFAHFEEAVAYVKTMSAGFGPHDAQGWADLTRFVFYEQDGRWVKHYDLRLAQAFAQQTPPAMEAAENFLWRAWDHLPVPSLVLRGAQSDILSAPSLAQMLKRNPLAHSVEFAGVGHAPTLRSDDQIAAVHDFLLAPSS